MGESGEGNEGKGEGSGVRGEESEECLPPVHSLIKGLLLHWKDLFHRQSINCSKDQNFS